ncbi:hypothetical protein MML48_1g14934 [Holotrichia oblita]|uniref:Uncharacterized protein n=1 Tax=Holotrichia oblita TaxID=644536 RepID=A0ACB9TUR6_HOLOL|nr:hypothetical protein MML48_1g14934 [Holotrichia oblita]
MTPNLNKVPAILKGRVSASMKNKIYDVEIHIDKDDGIVAATCACPRGLVTCHHMAALCVYARDNISVTDTQCSWNIRRRIEESSVKTQEDLFPPRRKGYVACKTDVSNDAVEKLKESFTTFDNAVGFSWLLSPEPTVETTWSIKPIESILYSHEYIKSTNKIQCFVALAGITNDTMRKVTEATIGQSKNNYWLITRKHRLTANHFGRVLAAVKANKYPTSLYKSLLNEYNLDGIRAIQWGKENEPLALNYAA